MNKKLLFSALAGIVSVVFLINSFVRFIPIDPSLGQIFLYVSLAAYISYVYGFVTLGEKFNVKTLKYLGYVWIACAVVGALSQLVSTGDLMNAFVSAVFSIQSALIVILGWTMLQMKEKMGTLAVLYGVCAILAGSAIPFIFGGLISMGINTLCYLFAIPLFVMSAKK